MSSEEKKLTCRSNGENRFTVVLSPLDRFTCICFVSIFILILAEISLAKYIRFGIHWPTEYTSFAEKNVALAELMSAAKEIIAHALVCGIGRKACICCRHSQNQRSTRLQVQSAKSMALIVSCAYREREMRNLPKFIDAIPKFVFEVLVNVRLHLYLKAILNRSYTFLSISFLFVLVTSQRRYRHSMYSLSALREHG